MKKPPLYYLEKTVLLLLIFLLPTQLAYHLWPSWAFVFGIRVDLLSPSLYLTDLFVFILIIFNTKIIKNYWKVCLAILVLGILNILFSTSFYVTLYKWLKMIEIMFLTLYFSKQKFLKLSVIVKTFFYSLILFSLIGIMQFIKGATMGGLLYFLGERTFNQSTPGIALVSLFGKEYLRAYSTFSHPNSMAGYIGACIVFIFLSRKLNKNVINIFGVLVILICFVLTFSMSAYIGIFFILSFYLFSKNNKVFKNIVLASLFLFVVCSILLPIVSPLILSFFPTPGQNILQRLDLAYISGQMITQAFLFGKGLGTFVISIPMYKGIFTYSWLLQPVHNIFLLILAETGIVGLLSFCYLVFKVLLKLIADNKNYLLLPIMLMLFTGLFDHYTISLQQNLLLFAVFVGMSFNEALL